MMVSEKGTLISLSGKNLVTRSPDIYYRGVPISQSFRYTEDDHQLSCRYLCFPVGLIDGSNVYCIANLWEENIYHECRNLIDVTLGSMRGEDTGSLYCWRYK